MYTIEGEGCSDLKNTEVFFLQISVVQDISKFELIN